MNVPESGVTDKGKRGSLLVEPNISLNGSKRFALLQENGRFLRGISGLFLR